MRRRKRKAGLVFSRRAGERFLIAGGIAIEVARVAGKDVTLRVVAPGGTQVWREEIAPGEFLAQEARAA